METVPCINCNESVLSTSNFCSHCGERINCKECKSFITIKGSKFCGECGASLIISSTKSKQSNTLSYHKKGDEIRCDVSLTNEVGKEGFKALVESITGRSRNNVIALSAGNNEAEIELIPIEPANSQEKISLDEHDNREGVNNISAAEFKEQKHEVIIYPNIDDLLKKRSLTELEWILIFAFYESGFGQQTFTYDTVRNSYRDKRKSESGLKKFSEYWNVLHVSFFNTETEGIFRFEYSKLNNISDCALGKVSGIITKGGTAETRSSIKPKATKKEKGSTTVAAKSSKSVQMEEFDIIANTSKPSLQEFYNAHQPQGNKDTFGLIAVYICLLNKSERFTAGNVDYACRVLKIERKNNLKQSINNIKNETLWFDGVESGVWKLNRKGEVELETMFITSTTKNV